MSPTNVFEGDHLTSFSDVSTSGWVQLTNVAEIDLPFELFLTWSPAQRSFLNDPSIIEAHAGNGNRKGKRIPIKNLFAGSGTFRHNECMKNKNTLTPEAIIDIAGKYEYLTSKVYQALKELKDLMDTKTYKEAVEVLYTEDPALEEAAIAVENANMNGEFSCFIQDLTEIVHLWEKE